VIRSGVLARWRDRLPVTARTPALTLGEGDTPLVAAPSLARDVGCSELWLKVEGQNPTGSFKDRGMVVAVAKAAEAGAAVAVCASTGNTSASAAAYCAAAESPAAWWCPKARWRWASWRRRSRTERASWCCAATSTPL